MKFKIWYWWNDKTKNFWMNVAFMMPDKIVYWCAIKVFSHATTGAYSNTHCNELTFTDGVSRFGKDHNLHT